MQDPDERIDSLLHVADIHFWRVVANPLRLLNKRFLGNLSVLLRRRFEFVMERVEPFADALAATGVRFAVLTGDLTSTSLDEEFVVARDFARGLRRRGLEVAVLPGNHDVYTFESQRKRRFERYFAEFLPENGHPSRVVLPGGTSLILVPTVRANWLSARGYVGTDVIERVRKLLDQCGDEAVVAAHYPLLHRTPGYHSGWSRRLQNAEALRAAIGTSGRRILYLCGHVHRFSYVRDPEYPGLEHLSTGPFIGTSAESRSQGEFTEIHIAASGFRVVRHVHEEKWKTCRVASVDITARPPA